MQIYSLLHLVHIVFIDISNINICQLLILYIYNYVKKYING